MFSRALPVAASLLIALPTITRAGDQPQWGQRHSRNMVSTEKGLPDGFDPVAGTNVRLCAAEDLVLHKLASERPRDREDVEGVIVRQAGALDREYLDPLVSDLAGALERSEIVEFYRACLRKAGLRDT